MKNLGSYVVYAVGVVAILLISAAAVYGVYYFRKSVNYSVLYEDKVEQTVCRMVKPEHLIKPCG